MHKALRWLAIAAVGALAVVMVIFLLRCGPTLVERPGDKARGEDLPEPPARAEGAEDQDKLTIGWTAWADAQVVTRMAQRILQRHTDLEVERQRLNIGIQYQGVASGSIDIMLMAWLPLTHQNYWAKVRDRVVNLGPLYKGRLGWVVPDYIPESAVASLSDLTDPEVARRMGGRIQGIDPGSGLMQASARAMEAYDLDGMELVSSSGAAMTAVLSRAIRQEEWVVATAWRPHWVFARFDLRFLKDPKGILGGTERVHALARQGFQGDFPPRITGFFSRMYLPDDELAALLLRTQEVSVEKAVAEYIDEHPRRVRYWLTGKLPDKPADNERGERSTP